MILKDITRNADYRKGWDTAKNGPDSTVIVRGGAGSIGSAGGAGGGGGAQIGHIAFTPYKTPLRIDIMDKMFGNGGVNTQTQWHTLNPFDLIKQHISNMPKCTNVETQKRALALLLLQKLMKLLVI